RRVRAPGRWIARIGGARVAVVAGDGAAGARNAGTPILLRAGIAVVAAAPFHGHRIVHAPRRRVTGVGRARIVVVTVEGKSAGRDACARRQRGARDGRPLYLARRPAAVAGGNVAVVALLAGIDDPVAADGAIGVLL